MTSPVARFTKVITPPRHHDEQSPQAKTEQWQNEEDAAAGSSVCSCVLGCWGAAEG